MTDSNRVKLRGVMKGERVQRKGNNEKKERDGLGGVDY